MSNIVEMLPSKELIGRASENYYRNLRLPTNSRVLIITDKQDLADRVIDQNAANKIVRRQMADNFKTLMDTHKLTHATVEFDDRTPEEELYGETTRALGELGAGLKENEQATIIYIGNNWEKRSNIYRAAEDFGKNHKVKLAVSLGFSTGDCKVMAELDEEKMKQIDRENIKFTEFFEQRPEGQFEIKTMGVDENERTLNISYNTKEAPFEPDTGRFDEANNNLLSEHVKYINIPGGEIFAAPYPFQKTTGEFAAQGMLFTVENGFVTKVTELKEGAMNGKDEMQTLLVNLIQKEGKKIPVAELGLGYYELIGVNTYSNSSILSLEKSGPHIGFAHPYTTSEKKVFLDALAEQGTDFGHTDFVMDNPVMMWQDLDGNNREQFYPPLSQSEGIKSGPGTTDVK